MSKKRYFYTDPLRPAWMAKHFGMRFDCDEAETPWDICAATMCQTLTPDDEPYYIHPDSLHLLEPREGDYGVLARPDDLYDLPMTYTDAQWVIVTDMGYCGPEVADAAVQIIQRNGIPFHWPESETA